MKRLTLGDARLPGSTPSGQMPPERNMFSRMTIAPRLERTPRDQELMKCARRHFQWHYHLAEQAIGQPVLGVGCGLSSLARLLLDRELVLAVDVEHECITGLAQQDARSRDTSRDALVAFTWNGRWRQSMYSV